MERIDLEIKPHTFAPIYLTEELVEDAKTTESVRLYFLAKLQEELGIVTAANNGEPVPCQ